MLTLVNNLIRYFSALLHQLNSTSLKRLLIYAALFYPLTVLYLYNNEIKLLMKMPDTEVSLQDVTSAQDRCFSLRQKYLASAVILSLYQPSGVNKTYKEVTTFSTDNSSTPLTRKTKITLISRAVIASDFEIKDYTYITSTSGHKESPIMSTYNLDKAYVIPLHDANTGQIIGEVMWIFKNAISINVNDIMRDSQIFLYDIK